MIDSRTRTAMPPPSSGLTSRIQSIARASAADLQTLIPTTSWHSDFEASPVIHVSGVAPGLTEGDLLTVFAQYGRIDHVNLVRDPETGRPRGYAFLRYEDPRSAVLAVDNFNGIQLVGREICVDHVKTYRLPPPEHEVLMRPPPSE